MKKIKFILIIFLLFVTFVYSVYITALPINFIVMSKEKIKLRKLFGIEILETTRTSKTNIDTTNLEVKLFGKILLKEIAVTKIENIKVVPVGKVIGLKMYTNGVLVVGMSEIEDKNNIMNKPYENTDIQEGDTILKINEKYVEDIEDLKSIVSKSKGNNLEITLLRDGILINTNIKAIETKANEYKLGLWVKDAATGVGTMSFYEPQSKAFAVLGHGITDSDTNDLINIDSGELVTTKIISLKKGTEGMPGELKGTIINQETIGIVNKNTQFGVFGKLNNLTALNIDTSKSIDVAVRDEIKEGEATILCAFNENNVAKQYKIEIQKIYKENDYNNKSMLIKVIDKELLEETGGIIRGLSGAPIVQNGKFVGAVTNVLVSNPEIGYAIFADLMIKELNRIDY